ncbi:MAG: histidine--tRNA ligase [Bacteroidetes bacterium]|nr:histidine--tRNA ligase [Bacteroidota bacterium]
MSSVSIPSGTRDFSPVELRRRNYIFDIIKQAFVRFGYSPIETPAMENLITLTGKYGDEGDQLLYKILNSRIHESKDKEKLQAEFNRSLAASTNSSVLTERALRYDLTVPFARYVVMHRNEITLPFKRSQIQPVWRADKPQKGRYREFFQCDADVIGSKSLWNEIELIKLIDYIFTKINLGVCIKLNNRKILSALALMCDAENKVIDLTVAIDKLEKIGMDKVLEELQCKGFSTTAIEKLLPILNLTGSNEEKINTLKVTLANYELGVAGLDELQYVLEQVKTVKTKIEIDLTLARGLNYYTGAIIEVTVNDSRSAFTSSICGGGRYDDLTGIFGMPGVSGVGISFGADRIYDVLLECNLFPDFGVQDESYMCVNFGNTEAPYAAAIVDKLRAAGKSSILYPDADKIKKQMSYANSYNFKYVIVAGSEEIESNSITLKNMISGEQQKISLTDFFAMVE